MEPAAKRRRKESEEEEDEDDVIEHAAVPQDQEVDLGSIKDKLSKKKDNKSKKAKQGANSIEKFSAEKYWVEILFWLRDMSQQSVFISFF